MWTSHMVVVELVVVEPKRTADTRLRIGCAGRWYDGGLTWYPAGRAPTGMPLTSGEPGHVNFEDLVLIPRPEGLDLVASGYPSSLWRQVIPDLQASPVLTQASSNPLNGASLDLMEIIGFIGVLVGGLIVGWALIWRRGSRAA
jgi:hypothetical protein